MANNSSDEFLDYRLGFLVSDKYVLTMNLLIGHTKDFSDGYTGYL